jgi:hypothetical protein
LTIARSIDLGIELVDRVARFVEAGDDLVEPLDQGVHLLALFYDRGHLQFVEAPLRILPRRAQDCAQSSEHVFDDALAICAGSDVSSVAAASLALNAE